MGIVEQDLKSVKTKQVLQDYLNLDWSLIPVCAPDGNGLCCHHSDDCHSPGKRALVSWSQHQKRRASLQQLKRWWGRWPDANIAVITGSVSGIAVLDEDRDGVLQGEVPTTASSTTGKGRHYYFNCDRPLKSTGEKGVLELKAEGNYVVLPPSVHPSGANYRWQRSPLQTPLAEIPGEYLVEDGQRADGMEKPPLREVIAGVEEGQRNDQTTRVAGKLIGVFPPKDWEELVWPLLVSWNRDRNDPPLPLDELRQIFDSVSGREVGKALRAKRAKELLNKIVQKLDDDPTISERKLYKNLNANRYLNSTDHFALLVHQARHICRQGSAHTSSPSQRQRRRSRP